MENPKTLTPDEKSEELVDRLVAEHKAHKLAERKAKEQTKTFSGAGTEKRGAA